MRAGAHRRFGLGFLDAVSRAAGATSHWAAAGPKLRAFVDAQLLITAQSDAASTDLAYGATALDIAREGTFHLPLGVSGISVARACASAGCIIKIVFDPRAQSAVRPGRTPRIRCSRTQLTVMQKKVFLRGAR